MPGIFVSHTHSDRLIVEAFDRLVNALFNERVKVKYSSSKELESGVAGGSNWLTWIMDEVRDADIAVIMLTPSSVQKPWVLWEAGAVSGAALSIKTGSRLVCPVTFGLHSEQVPNPFAQTQIVNGLDQQEVVKFLRDIPKYVDGALPHDQQVKFGMELGPAVKSFVDKVSDDLRTLPHAVTEAAIQEWLARLDELDAESRFSEAVIIEDWLNVAFGRDEESKQRPLDLRIHRRLGQLYATAGQSADAARQLELGRQLAPRDIFLLRRLGKAYLDQRDLAKAGDVLNSIKKLDSTAFVRNSENAALQARFHELGGNIVAARDVLHAAYEHSPNYYLGDRLAQMHLKLGNLERAKDVYSQVRNNIRELRETNVWTCATALTAAIVLNSPEEIRRGIEEMRLANPSREEMESIERGVKHVLDQVGGDPSILLQLRAMEQRQAA